MSRPTIDHTADRPEDWAAPGARLVRSAATDVVPPLASLGKVHIMGIAGSGMSALARILLERGIEVSGCEARESLGVSGLRALGADVQIGHSRTHVDACDTFVYTTAINPKHEEFAYARQLAEARSPETGQGKTVLRRAAALAAALEDRRTIAISGTHGKTTTTSLLTIAAQACGIDPSFAIGGNLYESGKNAHLGTGDLAIVEADESDGSFLLTQPIAAVITNVEADHLENHGDLEGIFRAFEQFVDRVGERQHSVDRVGERQQFVDRVGEQQHSVDRVGERQHSVDRIEAGGLVLACIDDPGARRIAQYARTHGHRVLTYGESAQADVMVSDIVTLPTGVAFTAKGEALGGRRVIVGSLIGRHMALNATAALMMAVEVGLDLDTVLESFANFGGVHRRMEYHGEGGEVRVFDDYAHHPTEVAAQLTAAKAVAAPGRLIAVFQPGTYSRTQTFAREFADAMQLADIAVVMDIFPAREEPIPGVTGATISDLIDLPPERVIYEASYNAVPERVAAVARAGDLVLTMGIGNVYLLCDEIRAACAAASTSRVGS
jgi:UDP-N-acetylmuramate--alanine ligase